MQVNPVQEIEIAEKRAANMVELAREKRLAILKAADKATATLSASMLKEAEQKAAAIIQEAQNLSMALPIENPDLEQIRRQVHERQASCTEELLRMIPGLVQ